MGFLLIKMLFLLGVAAVCGGLFAYWWFRRHYEDVTLEYARSREEWQAWRRGFEERLAARPPVDLEPLAQQVAAVQAAVGDIPPPERVDLSPVHMRLDELARRVGELRTVDLAPTNQRLMAIEHALFPLQTRLDELESAVRALRAPAMPAPAPEPAGAPASESAGEPLQAQEESPTTATPAPVGVRNLLTHPVHGEPDDLTQIKGVPKVLERTLHQVGVYYFWQIAEWSPEEVASVDSQLERFQGRIGRDDWVAQASELAALPTASRRPERH